MTKAEALALVARWEHGDEAHRQWLRDMVVPDLMALEVGWADAVRTLTKLRTKASPARTPDKAGKEWSDYDAETRGFSFEPGIGLTIDDDIVDAVGSRWLSWDETVAFGAWLAKKIDAP